MTAFASYFHKDTGKFCDVRITASSIDCALANCPKDHEMIIGHFDHLSQRIDIAARDKALNDARAAHPANVEAARSAHEQAQLDARAKHESSQDLQRKVSEAAIADAIANNHPRPRNFITTPFVEQPFIAPVFDEAAELHKATLAAVVEYQPPQPSKEHEWNADAKRWQLTRAAQQRNAEYAAAKARIAELELKQARRVRELLATNDPQLKAINDEIEKLRGNLSR